MIQETIKETIAVGRTVESAVAAGAKELGADPGSVTYEVLEQPKKGFLGFGEAPAKVKVFYTVSEEDMAVSFVKKILADMEIDAQVSVTADVRARRDRLINISGEEAGALIGHHGETLEALQYLVNLAASRKDEGEDEENRSSRYTVDIENYRARREQTLKRLAHRMSEKAIKTHRSVALEPMNPYERRIIHAEVQNIAGVTTSSVGSEGNRRVVIYPGDGVANKGKGRRRRKGNERAEQVNEKADVNVDVEVDVDVDIEAED